MNDAGPGNVRRRNQPNQVIEPEAKITRNEEDEQKQAIENGRMNGYQEAEHNVPANAENRVNEVHDNAADKRQDFACYLGVEWTLISLLEVFSAKVCEVGVQFWDKLRNGVQIWDKLQNWRFTLIAKKRQMCNEGRKIWRKHPVAISLVLFFIVALVISLVVLYQVFFVQVKIQSYEEFVKEKDNKFIEIIDQQNQHVGDLYKTQDEMKAKLKTVEENSRENLENHTGELQEIKGTIVDVSNNFQKFMVESQMHIVELQQENKKMQEEIRDMQQDMNQEMGSIRGDVDSVRKQYERMKMSLDSIDYNIHNLRKCGFWTWLFQGC